MTERSFFGLVGVLAVSLDWLLFRIYHWIQISWEGHFRTPSNLSAWWLFTGILFFMGYSGIVGILLVLTRSHLKTRITPVAASILIDTGMTIILWVLSTLFDDPLFKNHLISVGLWYLPALFFWGGILWLLVGCLRIALLWPHTASANSPMPK